MTMIGSFSHIPYTKFAMALGPVALIGLAITMGLVALFHREEFSAAGHLAKAVKSPHPGQSRARGARIARDPRSWSRCSSPASRPAKAAIIIGGLLLLTRRVKSRRDLCRDRLVASVDVRGSVHHRRRSTARALLTPSLFAMVGHLHLDQIPVLSAVTAVLSNLVSNVPAVLLMKPVVEPLANVTPLGAAVAMDPPWRATSLFLGRSQI